MGEDLTKLVIDSPFHVLSLCILDNRDLKKKEKEDWAVAAATWLQKQKKSIAAHKHLLSPIS